MDAKIFKPIKPKPRFWENKIEIPVVAKKHQKAEPTAMPKEVINTFWILPLIPIEAAKKVLGPGSHTARQNIPHAVINEYQKCTPMEYEFND